MKYNIEFESNEIKLRGWFYKNRPGPIIIMVPGFTALKEHRLEAFALEFFKSGFSVLLYDNRNFGESEGEPRFEVTFHDQTNDLISAIHFAKAQLGASKIGLWGTSFSGAIVLAAAAKLKTNVDAMVCQVPFIQGHHRYLRLSKPDLWEKVKENYARDKDQREKGQGPIYIPVVKELNAIKENTLFKTDSAYEYFKSVPEWKNKVTLKSVENTGDLSLFPIVKAVTVPTLYIVASDDKINLTNLATKAFKCANEPKKLVMIEGDHFCPYVKQFKVCSTAAKEWFEKYLIT